jgi:phosphatidylinositol alpha-1,6-mannosyltransferase
MRTRGLRPFANAKRYLSLAWRVRRLVKREGITAIHAARTLPEGFTAYLVRRMTGTPYVCYVHGEEIGVSSTSRELAWMTRRVFAKASRIIANSQNTQNAILTDWRIPPDNVRLLHPGVDTKRFVPAPRDDGARSRLGWHGHTVLLTVGRLQKRKGHDMLIRALPAILNRVPNALYAIVGDGDERHNLEAIAETEGVSNRVQFMGEVADDQLTRSYQQCDLFVLPNRAVGRDVEGFGIVLLEAQSCGKPVVAGASGGTAETMHVGQSGQIVACESPEPLVAALIELLRDSTRLEEMGKIGRRWVCDRFDWESLCREAAQNFREI